MGVSAVLLALRLSKPFLEHGRLAHDVLHIGAAVADRSVPPLSGLRSCYGCGGTGLEIVGSLVLERCLADQSHPF